METIPNIALLYAGILGLMNIVLAVLAGRLRGSTGISVGDGGNSELTVAMRRHGNFSEFVPLALILLVLLEIAGVASTAIYVLGGLLVLARVCHAIGIKANSMQNSLRIVGAAVTALLSVVMSVWAIVQFVQ